MLWKPKAPDPCRTWACQDVVGSGRTQKGTAMGNSRRLLIRTLTTLFVCLFMGFGCAALRTEFYRGETAHLLKKGNRYYRSGEYKEARARYEDVVRLDPGSARAHAGLGNIAYVRGEFATAAGLYLQAVTLDPSLEKALMPLYLEAKRHHEAEELRSLGADLDHVIELLTTGREDDVEALFEKGMSPSRLAGRAGYLSSSDQDRLLNLAGEKAAAGNVPIMCALFYGHLLAWDDHRAFHAARLLKSAAVTMEGLERQEAYMALGAIYVRLGRENDAAGAYEQALLAGSPREDVLPYLAALYGVPVDAFGEVKEMMIESAGVEDRSIETQTSGRISGSLRSSPNPGRSAMAVTHHEGPDRGRAVEVLPVE